MKKVIEIEDELIDQLGEKLADNKYKYDGKIYRLVSTAQVEKVSYYVEESF